MVTNAHRPSIRGGAGNRKAWVTGGVMGGTGSCSTARVSGATSNRLQQVTARLLNTEGNTYTVSMLSGPVMTGMDLLSLHRLDELHVGLGVLQFG